MSRANSAAVQAPPLRLSDVRSAGGELDINWL
jgi:hypothetical protein